MTFNEWVDQAASRVAGELEVMPHTPQQIVELVINELGLIPAYSVYVNGKTMAGEGPILHAADLTADALANELAAVHPPLESPIIKERWASQLLDTETGEF